MNYRILAIAIILVAFMFNGCDDKPTQPTKVNYTFVTIGTQVWMDKNLDVDHYRNGDLIPEVKYVIEWKNLKTGAWCYYYNDPAKGAIYGKLYNWYAVNDPRGLAPEGWHIPSDAEWMKLSNYLGGEDFAGGKMRSTGTIEAGDGLWYSPNTGATNSSGFFALPGGYRDLIGTFDYSGRFGYWWSSSEGNSSDAWDRFLSCYGSRLNRDSLNKAYGFSVRCVKN